MHSILKSLLVLVAVPLLAACEYEGTAFLIDGKDQSITLVREQRWFWSDEVEQAVVVSRMPTCMRRHSIKSGVTGSVKMEVYEAGDALWALKQGKNWYLASTEKCEFQIWKDAPADPPGKHVGTFVRKAGKFQFALAEAAAKPITPPGE